MRTLTILLCAILLVAGCATYTATLKAEGTGDVVLSSSGWGYAAGTGTAELMVTSSDGKTWGPYNVGEPGKPYEIAFRRVSGFKIAKADVAEAKKALGLE